MPTGTVTFLFTDVVGSTRLWQEYGDAMGAALARHDEILRGAIVARRGVVFSTAGDSFAAAFWTPQEAVEAALVARAALGALEEGSDVVIRVRMGMHTGGATERDGDYFGPTLNRAARIMGMAHGGQVLASDATAGLLGHDDLVDLGEHELKDVAGQERIWQVGGGVFPPLRTGHRAADLPVRHRSFVGRDEERRQLAAALGPGHVVTLVGVGGVGKTRLALEVAHESIDAYDGRVWWCDLAAIDDPSTLDLAVASMLSVHPQADLLPPDAIVDALRARRGLVVLDNCEHVLDEVAALVTPVVDHCPRVAVMATSREPLGLDVETVWPVRPLDPEDAAVELFLDRARAADATFEPSEDPAVLAELCRHLDGMPLAIELAAARVRSMTPAELLAGLHDRFRLLRGGRRGGLDRHRTLAATLDWSYSLLRPDEKALLDRLSVFPASFDVGAVAAICGGDPKGDASEAMETLASLVDKSMVVADRGAIGTRYRLLETVRVYGEGHAIEQDELEGLRDRHLAHYLTVAERGFDWWLNEYPRGRALFDHEWDNLRAAAQHAQDLGDAAALERLFAAIAWPASYGLVHEVGEWATRACAIEGVGSATFGCAATLAGLIGRFDECEQLARAGLAAAASPDAPETWMCWTGMFQGLARTGWTPAANEAVVAAHETATAAIGAWGDAFYSATLATWNRADPEVGGAHAAHASTVAAAHQNPQLSADVAFLLGLYHGMTGDPTRGLAYCRDSLALTEAYDLPRSRNAARQLLAQVAMLGGLDDPVPLVGEAIEAAHRQRLWWDLAPTIRMLARWWIGHGQAEPAAVVVGYLDAHGLTTAPSRGVLQQVRTDPAAQQGRAEGALLDRDQLVAHILAHLSPS